MASGYRSRREAPHDMNGAAILLRSWHLCCPIMSSSRNTTPVTVAWQNLRALGRAIPAAERSAATSARHSRMVRRAGFTVALAAGIAALSFAAAQSASMTVAETGSTLIYPLFNESYQRGCQEKFFPSSPKGDECCGLHPAQSQFWRGCGRAAHSRQTKPVDGFYSTVS